MTPKLVSLLRPGVIKHTNPSQALSLDIYEFIGNYEHCWELLGTDSYTLLKNVLFIL